MADKNDVVDIANSLNIAVQNLHEAGKGINDAFSSSAGSASQLSASLNVAVQRMKDAESTAKKLPTSFKELLKIIDKMKPVLDFSSLKKMMKAAPTLKNLAKTELGSIMELPQTFENVAESAKEMATELEEVPFVAQELSAKKLRQEFGKLHKQIDNLTPSLKELAVAEAQNIEASKGLPEIVEQTDHHFSDLFDKLNTSPPELKGLRDLQKIFTYTNEDLKKGAMIAGGLIAGATVSSAAAALKLLQTSLMETWDYINDKVFPTNAQLNRELGNMGGSMSALRSQSLAVADTFESLGLPFETATTAVRTLASSMMTVTVPKETLELGLKLSEYVGLGAENAGKLTLAFQKSEGSIKNLDKAMRNATVVAREYGIPVNQIRRDMGENIGIVQRFGTANVIQFSKAAAKARSYGLDIRQVDAAFGKVMDSFDGTSDVAAKLNTIFNTNINSLELMLETDPTKRMEMLRKELVKQGKTWDNINVFEKNVITSTLQLNEEQAALAFGSEGVRKKLQAQAAEQARVNKINMDWDKGLLNIKNSLINVSAEMGQLYRAVANVISKMFAWDNSFDAATDTAKIIKVTIDKATEAINEWGKSINPAKDNVIDLKKVFADVFETIKDLFNDAETAFYQFKAAMNPRDFASSVKIFDKLSEALGENKNLASLSAKELAVIGEELNNPDVRLFLNKQFKEGGLLDVNNFDLLVKNLQKVGNINDVARQSADLFSFIRKTKEQRLAETTNKTLTGFGLDEASLRNMQEALSVVNVQDALITKTGKIVKFDPEDNIMATKNPVNPRAPTGTSNNRQDLNQIRIEVVDINLDGKKIGEATVRISRM